MFIDPKLFIIFSSRPAPAR